MNHMSGPTVSVIMPAFNADATVEMSIRSVLQQELTDFELIVVDDASSDGTATILDHLQRSERRIRCLHNEANLGQGLSRNRGIETAQGRYVAFLDSDDSYEPDFLSRLYRSISETDANVAQSRILYAENDRQYEYGSPAGIVQGAQASVRIDCLDDGLPYLTPQVCNKLYDAVIFRDPSMRFAPIIYEDTEFMPRLAAKIVRLTSLPQALYVYNKRYSVTTSAKARYTPSEISNRLDSFERAMLPYLDSDFQSRMTTWSLCPEAPIAMLRNELKKLTSVASYYTAQQRKAIAASVRDVLKRLFLLADGTPYDYKLAAIWTDFNSGFVRRFPIIHLLERMHRRLQAILYTGIESHMRLLDRVIPKRQGLFVYVSWARYKVHTLDSVRMVYEHNRAQGYSRNIVILNNAEPRTDPVTGLTFPSLHSVAGLWTILRSERLFTAYSLHATKGYRNLGGLPKREIIQLWHGTPMKNIGLLTGNQEAWWPNEVSRYAYVIAASEVDRETMAAALGTGKRTRTINSGLPRHDLLGLPSEDLPDDFQTMDKRIRRRLDGRRLVLFAPTWRQGAVEPMILTDTEFHGMELFARQRDVVFGVRFHANMLRPGMKMPSITGDHLIFFNDIEESNLLLRNADVLVTDYSSMYLDYMLLMKPVVLYVPDVDWFESTRGFIYPFDEFSPVDTPARTVDELMEGIDAGMDADWKPSSRYRRVLRRYHSYELDGSNSCRVMDMIGRGRLA